MKLRHLSVLVVLLLCALTWAGQSLQLTILHTNDLHGMMLPFDYKPSFNTQPAAKDAGGLARRAGAIEKIRREATHPVVVIDTGDIFTRGPWHARCYGEPEIEAMNLMGYDLLVVGNNEFKAKAGTESQEMMLRLLRRSRFPWLAANLTVGDTGLPVPGVQPFIVRRIEGVKVGFLGLTAPRSAQYAQTRGWTISDPIEAARVWAPRARQECDILIAVTHIGTPLDQKLAKTVPGIDAVIGGDSHTFLRQPVVETSPDGRKVPIVQAGELGVYFGRLDLTFDQDDKGWRLTTFDGKVILLDNSVPEHQGVKELLDRYLQPEKTAQPLPAAA